VRKTRLRQHLTYVFRLLNLTLNNGAAQISEGTRAGRRRRLLITSRSAEASHLFCHLFKFVE
jgi:hypothetical protein